MPEVVQARCPHCRNLLRIPAAWVSQPMRCKHCGQVFQARDKPLPPERQATAVTTAPPAPPRAAAAAVTAAPPPPRPAGDPFSFDDPADDDAPVLRRSRRPPTRWWI